jgi:hypothetical protein
MNLRTLSHAALAPYEDEVQMIDELDIANRGIGWVDAHLLAAARRESSTL